MLGSSVSPSASRKLTVSPPPLVPPTPSTETPSETRVSRTPATTVSSLTAPPGSSLLAVGDALVTTSVVPFAGSTMVL